MAELKTRPRSASVEKFIRGVADEATRRDCRAVMKIMKAATHARPRMWGPSIVGFGDYHYKYESGREGDWFLTGFSPRRQNLTVYIMNGFEAHDGHLRRLGKFRTGKCCLYIKRLSDVDIRVLSRMVRESVRHMKRAHAR